jgi:hypothetical protein
MSSITILQSMKLMIGLFIVVLDNGKMEGFLNNAIRVNFQLQI